jgi:hypothetical protein
MLLPFHQVAINVKKYEEVNETSSNDGKWNCWNGDPRSKVAEYRKDRSDGATNHQEPENKTANVEHSPIIANGRGLLLLAAFEVIAGMMRQWNDNNSPSIPSRTCEISSATGCLLAIPVLDTSTTLVE